MTKQLLRQAQTARLDETLQLSAALQALAHHTTEHDGAVEAFFAQRQSR
jgi:2-(1,2-epoxy-1,2-dihydrophenyl)acetyl-CoA isomerase